MSKKDLGKRLNSVRKAQGITSERLSELCGVNATHIRSIEGGRRSPSMDLLVKICNTLHTSPNYLMQDMLIDNEVIALHGLSDHCKNLSNSQLERLNKIIDLVFIN